MERTVSISTIFRSKIDKSIYNFDIIFVDNQKLTSCLVGYCVVNIQGDKFFVGINEGVKVSQEKMEKIAQKALEEAKTLEKIFS